MAVHIEQVMWPNPPNTVKLHNLTVTEMWMFKERLYKGLVKARGKPDRWAQDTYCTLFEDNAETYYNVWTNGNPEMAWCYITDIGKLGWRGDGTLDLTGRPACGQET